MNETPFAKTGYARTLFESQIPELLKVLHAIATSLKTIAAASAPGADRPNQSAPSTSPD